MATCFHPFSDDSINAQFFHPFGQGNRRHNWNNDNTSSMEALHILTWISSTSCYNLDALFDDQINDIVCKWRQEHDIDTKGFVCNGLDLINVGLHDFLRGISPTDDTETTSIGDSTSQVTVSHPGHTTLKDGILDVQKFSNRCFHNNLLYFYCLSNHSNFK